MAKKDEPKKVTDEQIHNAGETVKKQKPKAVPAEKKKAAPKAKAKATPPSEEIGENPEVAKAKKSKIPTYLRKSPTAFIVGTEDYAKLITEHNDLFGTVWNVHRVRPAVFFGIYQQVRQYYEAKK